MLLEIVVGISVLSVCVTSVTLYAISFAKKIQDDEISLDKEELALIKQNQERIEKEKQKIEDEKLNSIPSRDDMIPLINGASGELKKCPFCGWNNEADKKIATGTVCKKFMDKKDTTSLANFNWRQPEKINGPSSGLTISTKSGPRLYQCCVRCFGEWVTMPKNLEKSIPPPLPNKDC